MSDQSPGSVGDALGDAGPCPVVKWNGREFKVGWPTPRTLARVELQIARTAQDELKELETVLEPADFAAQKAAVIQALAVRHHRAGGPLWNATFSTGAGLHLMLWGCVAEHHPDFTPSDASRMVADVRTECEFALLLVAPEFFRIAGAAAGSSRQAVEGGIERFKARQQRTNPTPQSPPS